MDTGEVIGYASINPSEELKELLNDHSYSIVNSEVKCIGIDESHKDRLKELKCVDTMSYDYVIKLLARQGISTKPEELIRKNAKELIRTFEVHELKFSDYFGMEGQEGEEIDELLSFTETYLGHTGLMYILHPISDYNPSLPMLSGELGYIGRNIYSLSVRDFSPEAIVIHGTNRVGAGNKLAYGDDIFPTKPIPMDSYL